MSSLSRLMWRCEAGLLYRGVIEEKLTEEIGTLVGRKQLREAVWQVIAPPEHREFDTRRQFDRAIDDAAEAVRTGKLRDCWSYIREAETAARHLEFVAEAGACIDAAKAAFDSLMESVSAEVRSVLPTLQSMQGQLRRARALFTSGEYAAARFVADFCSQQMDSAQAGGSDTKRNALLTRFAQLRDMHKQLCTTLSRQSTLAPLADALDLVQRLLERGQLELARQLLDDLQLLADSQDALISVAGRESVAVIDQSLTGDEDSWSAVTEQLLRIHLDRVAAKVEPVNEVEDSDHSMGSNEL